MKGSTTTYEPPANLEPWAKRAVEKLSPERKRAVLSFLEDMEIRGLSPCTMQNYIKAINTLNGGKPYEDLTAEDLKAWMHKLDSNGWTARTVNSYRVGVKTFLRWLHSGGDTDAKLPKLLRCIRIKRMRTQLPKDVLNEGEIKEMARVCKDQRDRALTMTGYESGGRRAEILGMKVGDLQFDEYGAVARVDGKTGQRDIRLVQSVPDLKLWLSMHSDKNNPEAPLWASRNTDGGELRGISSTRFKDLLKRAAKDAGVKKNVYPHLLRHSRATVLAKVLTEAQMRLFFGWSKNSRMPELYTHLSRRDTEDAILKHSGVKRGAEKPGPLRPRACPNCKAENPPTAMFCNRCNAPLTAEALHRSPYFRAEKLSKEIISEMFKGASPEEAIRQKLGEIREIMEMCQT